MTLSCTPGRDYYTPFYLLATLTNVVLLLWEGWRRGFPLRSWLTLVAASSLALILGSKLITHPVGEWATVLFSNAPTDTARSVLGGSVAAALTVLALRRWLGLSWAVLDALALPLCGALVVQCVGCVLTGCCFGEPTTGAWGLTYAAGTLPWAAQVQAGLLPATAAYSLPVAPTQLLALLLCAAVGSVLLITRHRRWPVGSWLLLQTGLLLLGRFVQGFWRAPVGEPVAGGVHTALGWQWLELQLWLLPLALLALGMWAWRIRNTAPLHSERAATTSPVGPGRTLAVAVAMLALTALLGRSALTLPEMLVVRALLLTIVMAEASAVLAALHQQGPRLVGVPLAVALAGVLLLNTAQTPAPSAEPVVPNADLTRTTTLTGGMLGSQHDAEQTIQQNNSGCSGSQRLALQQQVRGGGGEVAVETTAATGNSGTWGGGLWVGQQRIEAQPIPDPNGRLSITDRDTTFRHTLVDLHIYREVHKEHNGFTTNVRLGLHIGSLGYFSYFGDGESRQSTPLMPEIMVQIGRPAGLFGQADFCYGAENALGGYTTRLGLGSELGFRNGPRLLAGYAYSPHHPTPSMGFASALLRLPGSTGFSLEPYYATDGGRHNNFSVKLNYRIGH